MKSLRRGFTLIEMLIVISVFSVLIVVVFNAYSRMIHVKVDVEARQTLTDKSYFLMEKLQVLMADYTIDYEEYYNRKIVGCDQDGLRGTGGDNGICDRFTWYGNGQNNGNSQPLYCSSGDSGESGVLAMSTCLGDRGGLPQPYRSYAQSFVDMRNDVDQVPSVVNDEDDVDLGMGPVAIAGDVSELYLINHQKNKRLFLRRSLLDSGDRNDDGVVSDTDNLYSLQQLQLVGIDAGYGHNFVGSGAFDGETDTWMCDIELGYMCSGVLSGDPANAVRASYHGKGYRMPVGVNEGRVDLLGRDITLSKWKVDVSPQSDYRLSWADDGSQISPSVTISLTTQLYGGVWSHRLGDAQVNNFRLPLQTTFAMKEFYR